MIVNECKELWNDGTDCERIEMIVNECKWLWMNVNDCEWL